MQSNYTHYYERFILLCGPYQNDCASTFGPSHFNQFNYDGSAYLPGANYAGFSETI